MLTVSHAMLQDVLRKARAQALKLWAQWDLQANKVECSETAALYARGQGAMQLANTFQSMVSPQGSQLRGHAARMRQFSPRIVERPPAAVEARPASVAVKEPAGAAQRGSKGDKEAARAKAPATAATAGAAPARQGDTTEPEGGAGDETGNGMPQLPPRQPPVLENLPMHSSAGKSTGSVLHILGHLKGLKHRGKVSSARTTAKPTAHGTDECGCSAHQDCE